MSQIQQPPPPIAYQADPISDVDLTHLNVLAICFWVWGGVTALFSSIGLIHVTMGIFMVSGKFPGPTTMPNSAQFPADQFVGWLFIVMGGLIVSLGWIIGSLSIYTGFCLKRHRRWMLCMVVASMNCISIPIGTALGVFTIIVLVRPRVKQMFAANTATAA